MEMEKAQEELKDKIVRLEKEIDEIRDAVSLNELNRFFLMMLTH